MHSAIIDKLAATTSLGLWPTIGLLWLSWVVYRFVLAYQKAAAIRHHPGLRGLFSLTTIIGRLLPRDIPYVNESLNFAWRTHRKAYDQHRTSILSDVSLTGNSSYFFCSTPSAVRVLNGDRKTFRKPVEVYKILKYFGSNVLVTEGDEWRRHRKIVAPGFSDAVFEHVWKTTVEIYFEMARSEAWDRLRAGEDKEVMNVPELMSKMALTVLATASFGAPLSWSPDTKAALPEGHDMSFVEAITGVSENMFLTIALPDALLFNLPVKKLRYVSTAVKELKSYMYGMIKDRKQEIKLGETSTTVRRDLFNQLITASLDEEAAEMGEKGSGSQGLTDEELVGNTFIFALAGHETSAHTLAFTFGYLATNPEVQEWLYEELAEVMPDGHLPAYKDFARLPRTLAVLYETLRLHPSVNIIPKYATEDTTLMDDPESWFEGDGQRGTRSAEEMEQEEKRRVFVPKGTQVQIDVVNLHRHPVYWPNPHAFKPERFLGDYEKEAFVPFSAGARGCIGRRFAEVESVAFIAMVVRHFRLTPAKRTTPAGETQAQTAERLLRAKGGLTLTPVKVELDFARRSGEGVARPEFD